MAMKNLHQLNSLTHQPLLVNPTPLEAVQLQMDLNIHMDLDIPQREAIPTTKVWKMLSVGQKQLVLQALVNFLRVLVDEQVTAEVESPLNL